VPLFPSFSGNRLVFTGPICTNADPRTAIEWTAGPLLAAPGDANLFMKLRLNSGAAFDLTGKAGTMALLADALFLIPPPVNTLRKSWGAAWKLRPRTIQLM
jgi:hypothetical protein